MKLLNFTYTKDTGETSNRVLMPISTPSPNFFGVDLTDLDDEAVVAFALEYEEALNEFKKKAAEILAKHDLTHNYRNFAEYNMSEVESDEV